MGIMIFVHINIGIFGYSIWDDKQSEHVNCLGDYDVSLDGNWVLWDLV